MTTKINKISVFMLPANQQPLCHTLLIKCLTSCVTLFLEIWISMIAETWLVLEIQITLVSDTWFILEAWISLIPEIWLIWVTSIRTLSKSLTMQAKIITQVRMSKTWIILASKSWVALSKIVVRVHWSKCCKKQGGSRREIVKTHTERMKAQRK